VTADAPPPTTGHVEDRTVILEATARLCEAARLALQEAVDEPGVARACGRELGIDKSLAWKLVSLTQAPSPAEAITMMPGPRGWQQIIDALAATTIATTRVEEVRESLRAFVRETGRRGFDRRRLRTLATEVDTSVRGRMEANRLREAATAANTAIWGVGANTLIASYLLQPTGDSDRLAIAAVTMFQGLHRSRPGPEMAIHRRGRIRATGDATIDEQGCTIECADLCGADAMAEIATQNDGDEACVTFRGDRTSPAHPIDLVFAERLPSFAYMFARSEGELGSFGVPIWIPVHRLVLEVLVPPSIPWTTTPSAVAFNEISNSTHHLAWRDLHEFPVVETPETAIRLDEPSAMTLPPASTGGTPPSSKTYATAIERAAAAIGGTPHEYFRHRLIIDHPLLSSNVVLRWPLPARG
jgi:hypothetical protein